MNYKKIYDKLIDRCKNRLLEEYQEKHHIVPKCMGGDDSIDNLVLMLPEEHFLAHQLLVKIYPDSPKLIYACVRMTQHNSTNRINNKLYGWLKRKRSEIVSKQARLIWEQKRPEIVKKMKVYANSELGKLQRSESSKKVWQNAGIERKQQIRNLQKEFNSYVAERNKELWSTPEYRAKMAMRKKRGSDGSKLKEKWADPGWRAKMLEARKKKNEAR